MASDPERQYRCRMLCNNCGWEGLVEGQIRGPGHLTSYQPSKCIECPKCTADEMTLLKRSGEQVRRRRRYPSMHREHNHHIPGPGEILNSWVQDWTGIPLW